MVGGLPVRGEDECSNNAVEYLSTSTSRHTEQQVSRLATLYLQVHKLDLLWQHGSHDLAFGAISQPILARFLYNHLPSNPSDKSASPHTKDSLVEGRNKLNTGLGSDPSVGDFMYGTTTDC